MSLIKPIITTLPFAEHNFYYGQAESEQFYYEKSQCIRDCHFGTITDRKHLPPFIVRVPLTIDIFSNNTLLTKCANGTTIQSISPKLLAEVKAVIDESELAAVIALPPTLGDKYFVRGSEYLIEWNGAAFVDSGLFLDGLFIKDLQAGFTLIRKGDNLIKTNDGLQYCTIGGENYAICSGFEINETISCGLRKVCLLGPNFRKDSELIDVRDFDFDDNEYFKLKITNVSNLGNIPYSGVFFEQWYYFDKEVLVGEPKSTITEEKEEDGYGNEKITYQKRRKVQQLDTEAVPEYIADFLEFAQFHDNIFIKYPNESDLNCIENYEAQNDWLETACYGVVNLQFSTEEDIIKTNCGQLIDKELCVLKSFDVISFEDKNNQAAIEALPPNIGDAYYITDDLSPVIGNDWENHIGQIAVWSNFGWKYTIVTEDLVIELGGDLYFWDGIEWRLLPGIECTELAASIKINGYVPQGTKGKVYKRITGTLLWSVFGTFTKAELITGANFVGVGGEDYDFKLLGVSNNCDYGFSEIVQCTMPSA